MNSFRMQSENSAHSEMHRAAANVTIVMCIAAAAIFSDMYITQPVLPLLSAEFGISPAVAGLSISAVVFCIALSSGFYGVLSDRVNRKTLMVTACALLVLPTLLCALAPNFSTLLVLRAAQGLLIPGITVVAVAYIGDLIAPAHVGRVVSLYIAATVVGGLSGRVISGMIASVFNWHGAFVFFAITTALTALLMWRVLPADSRPHHLRHQHTRARELFVSLRTRNLLGAFVIGMCAMFGFIGVFTYLPYYLTHAPFNLSQGIVSLAYVTYAAGVVVSPLAGRWSQFYSRRRLMGIGIVCAIFGIALTGLPVLWSVIAGLIFLNLGMFTAQALAPAYVNTRAARAKGSASAAYNTFYYTGAVLGSFLPGLAWQHFGWWGVIAACCIAMLIALCADVVLCQ